VEWYVPKWNIPYFLPILPIKIYFSDAW